MIVENYEENFDLNIIELKSRNIKNFKFLVKLIYDNEKIKTVVEQTFNNTVEKDEKDIIISLEFNFNVELIIQNKIEWIKIFTSVIPENLFKLSIKIESDKEFGEELFGLNSSNSSKLFKKLNINNIEKEYKFSKNYCSFTNKYSNVIKAGSNSEKIKLKNEVSNIQEEIKKIKDFISKIERDSVIRCPIRELDYSDYININEDTNYMNNIISKPC